MLKTLSSRVREYRRDSLLTPICMMLEVFMEVLIPFLMVDIIDKGIDLGDMNSVLRYGGILLLCAFLALLFGVLSGKFAATASAGFAKNLRHDLFHTIQDFSFSNIDKFSATSLITRLTTDITNLQNAYQMIIRVLVRSPAMFFFSLFAAFQLNNRLSLIFIGVAPILVAGFYIILRHVYPLFERVFKTYDRLNLVVQESLRGVRVVKAYVRDAHETEKFESVSEEIYKDFVTAERLMAFISPLMQFCMYSCLLLLSWFGARFIVSETLTTGQLMSLITYAMQILMSLMLASMVLVMVSISRASARRVAEVLEETSDIVNKENTINEVKDGSITFEDMGFGYQGETATRCLNGINLHIDAGKTVGIIGATGSAKTSLVQLIPRLYDATHGRVLVGGVDVRDYDLHTLRNAVAMVLQKNTLFSGTIRENLRWGNPKASDAEIEKACALAQAKEFIESFPDGYDTVIEQGATNISGGQKQRLCIARALLKKPQILILDDSTSAVDTKTDMLLQKAFIDELPNVTKLIIAQRISSVSAADMIIVLDSSRIDAVGTHDTLLASNKIYREVYHSQQKGGASDDAE